jgi:hypothetical protein
VTSVGADRSQSDASAPAVTGVQSSNKTSMQAANFFIVFLSSLTIMDPAKTEQILASGTLQHLCRLLLSGYYHETPQKTIYGRNIYAPAYRRRAAKAVAYTASTMI